MLTFGHLKDIKMMSRKRKREHMEWQRFLEILNDYRLDGYTPRDAVIAILPCMKESEDGD